MDDIRNDINLQHFRSRCARKNPHAVSCGQSQLYMKYDGGDVPCWNNLKPVGSVSANQVSPNMSEQSDSVDTIGWTRIGTSPNVNNSQKQLYKRNLFACMRD